MPSLSKRSYGSRVHRRVRGFLEAILVEVNRGELSQGKQFNFSWSEDGKTVTIVTTLQTIVHLKFPEIQAHPEEFKRAKSQANEALKDLRDFVEILDDHRVSKRGSNKWCFSLRLWGQRIDLNLAEFDELWKRKRSPASKRVSSPELEQKSPLKPGAPFPHIKLPNNLIKRPNALNAVKKLLLAEENRPLVVSAILGLGGLGKSVLAATLIHEKDIQERFSDGILWVTLGQNPDIPNLLSDWIQTLDKSRESISAMTKESASSYLHNLLIERRMLLVIDDVWNSAHTNEFRVGGPSCRVLVTTREAKIEGANYYPLDLMTEEEAIALVRKKMKQRWREQDAKTVKDFVRVLGYLPLALDLSVDQVLGGLSWVELHKEFIAERQGVALGTKRRTQALKLLDSAEAWDQLDEHEQRRYSLQACFNLSLKRLNSEQVRQFSWLGILPEDVTLSARIASVLWDLPKIHAQKGLSDLQQRSFLTDGGMSLDNEPTYRVHDLMHDTARSLITDGELGAEVTSLSVAHQEFLQRCRALSKDQCWSGLPELGEENYDNYIYRHLTWHMEQAKWTDEIHSFMAMSNEEGRNAWFEKCDRLGQPAIFVTDLSRAWRLAEAMYTVNHLRSLELQVRYALIFSSLNSLANNIPTELIAVLVEKKNGHPLKVWPMLNKLQTQENVARSFEFWQNICR